MLLRHATINANSDVFLDPNHSHFILVDDGSTGSFGREIDFRTKLETELRKGKDYRSIRKDSICEPNEDEFKVPMILIVVQGGKNTLLTIKKTVQKLIPILVIAVKT